MEQEDGGPAINAGIEELELRPALRRFAQIMERRLRENDHKNGWKDCLDSHLLRRLKDETKELEETLHASCPYCGNEMTPHHPGGTTVEEAADVANFAMMLADNNWEDQ